MSLREPPLYSAFRHQEWDLVRLELRQLRYKLPRYEFFYCMGIASDSYGLDAIPVDIANEMIERSDKYTLAAMLNEAAEYDNPHFVHRLLAHGVDVETKNLLGQTALEVTDSVNVARVLINAGARFQWTCFVFYGGGKVKLRVVAYLLSVVSQEHLPQQMFYTHDYVPLFERARYFVILMSPFHVTRIGRRSLLRILPQELVRLVAGFLWAPVIDNLTF